MKMLLLVLTLVSIENGAEAGLVKSESEVNALDVGLCRDLQGSLEKTAALSQHFKMTSDVNEAKNYEQIQQGILETFRFLECTSRLEKVERADAELANKCKSIRTRISALDDALDELSLGILRTGVKDNARDAAYAMRAKLVQQSKSMDCNRVLR